MLFNNITTIYFIYVNTKDKQTNDEPSRCVVVVWKPGNHQRVVVRLIGGDGGQMEAGTTPNELLGVVEGRWRLGEPTNESRQLVGGFRWPSLATVGLR